MNDNQQIIKEKIKPLIVLFKAQHSVLELAKKDVKRYGLNIAEFSALEVLYHKGELAVATLGEKILMPNSSLSYVLDKLSKKKLIVRKNDPKDRRISYINLSKLGNLLMSDIMPQHNEQMRKIFDRLSDEKQELLVDMLKTIGYYAKEVAGD